MRAEAVKGAVFQAKGHDSDTLTLVHDQIKSKVLHKEGSVVLQGLSVESVQKGMAGSVGSGSTAICLCTYVAWTRFREKTTTTVTTPKKGEKTEGQTLSVVEALSSKRTLVDLTLLGPRERDTVVLQLNDGPRCLSAHVVNSVLISEPIRSLHSVIHMPPPIILCHVAQGGVDATLCGSGVGAGGEKLGNARNIEAFLSQTEGSPETSTSSANNHSVILVVDDGVLSSLPNAQHR